MFVAEVNLGSIVQGQVVVLKHNHFLKQKT